MVKENSHAWLAGDPGLRDRETAFRVPKHKLHLFTRHPGEPLQEIINARAIFKIFKKCP